jgi:hypothetical protein
MRVAIAMALGVLLGAGSAAVIAGQAPPQKGVISMKVTIVNGYAKIDKSTVEFNGNPFLPAPAGAKLEKSQTAFAVDDPRCYYVIGGTPMYIDQPGPCP